MPDGSLVCSLADRQTITIPCPDALGLVDLPGGRRVEMQTAIDEAYTCLLRKHQDCRQLWDLERVRRWERHPATERQLKIIRKQCRGFDTKGLSKGDASQILNRLFHGRQEGGRL
jgi:hypothetical protein